MKQNNGSILVFKLRPDLRNSIVFFNQSTWEVYCAAVRTKEDPQTPSTTPINAVNRKD